MKDLNEASRRIGDIVQVIDGIAFQTNILALNAPVEAARAGEQGRGFAVVASEVHSLAGRSAEAAREIKTLISASVERVEKGSELVDQAGATMTEVVGTVAVFRLAS
jgi:methyl-accepting chemotaxis protein